MQRAMDNDLKKSINFMSLIDLSNQEGDSSLAYTSTQQTVEGRMEPVCLYAVCPSDKQIVENRMEPVCLCAVHPSD